MDFELLTASPLDDAREDTWAIVEWEYSAVLSESLLVQAVPYTQLAAAMHTVAQETLPKRPKRAPAWFAASEPKLRALIEKRDAALDALHRQPKSVCCRGLLNDARAAVKHGVREAKSAWILSKAKGVNDGVSGALGSKAAWDNVKVLKAGLNPPRRAAPAKMQKEDGTKATTAEENAGVFASHFEKLYGRAPTFDASMPDLLKQRPLVADADGDPTDDDIHRALSKLHDTAPGDSGLPAALWKALGATPESFALVRQIVLAFWDSEEMPD